MIEQFLGVSGEKLVTAMNETFFMVGCSLLFGTLIAIPLAMALLITREGGIRQNNVVYKVLNTVINVIRSVPFIIMLVFIMPVTKFIVHTKIGTTAALVPLVFYIAPYLARLIENSLLEVKEGVIEAAQSMGATGIQIIIHFILPEAMPSIILGLTTGTIGLIGATAMAGTIGGGGVGNLAITYGYQRFNSRLMLTTVIVLIIFVQFIQAIGNYVSKKLRTRS